MAITASNFDLGAMDVTFNSVDLGATKGGVTVTVRETQVPMFADQKGTGLQDMMITGVEFRVKLAVSEIKDVAMLDKIFPNAVLVTDSVDSTKKKLTFSNPVGTKLSSVAAALVLHPTHLGASAKNQDWKFTLAAPLSSSEIKYDAENQIAVEIEFAVLPHTDGSYAIWGDPTAAA